MVGIHWWGILTILLNSKCSLVATSSSTNQVSQCFPNLISGYVVFQDKGYLFSWEIERKRGEGGGELPAELSL